MRSFFILLYFLYRLFIWEIIVIFQVPNFLSILWDILLELDDLTASTNSVMILLSSLITITTESSELPALTELQDLVPRLWPFFKHNISSVRLSSLKTLKILIESSKVCIKHFQEVIKEKKRLRFFRRFIFYLKDCSVKI